MSASKARGWILLLSFLALILSLALKNKLAALVLSAACLLLAVVILYRNLGRMTDISPDNPKMKTLKLVTVFDGALLVLCVILAVLMETGVLRLSERQEVYLAGLIVAAFMLFAGNIAPRLPFSRHTGLRLPWTVADEDTWVVAHRILGYLSIPLALLYLACLPAMEGAAEKLTLAVILLWVGIPGGLSYAYYRKKFK